MGDRHELLGDDVEPALGQQEVDVRHAPRLRIVDRDHRCPGRARMDRVERVLEAVAGQRQRGGRMGHRRLVRVRAGRSAECDRARRIAFGGGAHCVDQSEGGLGKFAHLGPAAIGAARP